MARGQSSANARAGWRRVFVAAAALLIGACSSATPPASFSSVTTTAATLSDTEIAEASILSRQEVGEGFSPTHGRPISFSAADQPAARMPECLPFVDSVFENASRPATSRSQLFQRPAASFTQYTVVFPSEPDAITMMEAVGDPRFPACMAAIALSSYDAANTSVTEVTQQAVKPRAFPQLGDHTVVLALQGSYVYRNTSYPDEGLVPFVRVGRVVVMMNPSSSESVSGTPGYPDVQLERALRAIVERLRTAQKA